MLHGGYRLETLRGGSVDRIPWRRASAVRRPEGVCDKQRETPNRASQDSDLREMARDIEERFISQRLTGSPWIPVADCERV